MRVPTVIAELPGDGVETTFTTLIRWFEPAAAAAAAKKGNDKAAPAPAPAAPTEAANSLTAPLALRLFDDVNQMASPCADFIARHRAAAAARKGDAKKEATRTKKDEFTLKAAAHEAMVSRASDGCGAAAEAKYPGSSSPQRCLCVALETLPANNNAEARVMRILIPDGAPGAAFVNGVTIAAAKAVDEDRRVRGLLAPVRSAAAEKVIADASKVALSSQLLFGIHK